SVFQNIAANLSPFLTIKPKKAYYDLIINICSHGKHAGEETYLITDNDKRVLRFLFKHIRETIPFQQTTQLNDKSK
ncbi:MAG: hypothetical protein ACI3Z5_06910, partial [Paludibacteraceae bacterium]